MPRGLIGRKLGMTQVFTEDGTQVACTVLELGPCTVLQKKSKSGKDGYSALRLAYGDIRRKNVRRPKLGEFQKLGLEPRRFIREIRVSEEELGGVEVGAELRSDIFEVGDRVDITGISKGRGFTGVIKRHGFAGKKATHGTHEYFRHGGSIGMCAWPGKVIKGQKMAGQHGNKRVTVQNLTVIRAHPELNLVLVRGAVPGPTNNLIMVRTAAK